MLMNSVAFNVKGKSDVWTHLHIDHLEPMVRTNQPIISIYS